MPQTASKMAANKAGFRREQTPAINDGSCGGVAKRVKNET